MNHDISVGEMIDASDEAEIGLLGRDAELQFVRLAAAYNDQKAKIAMLREALVEARDMIEMCLPLARTFSVPQEGSPAAKIDAALDATANRPKSGACAPRRNP